jgi:hypothetical protein
VDVNENDFEGSTDFTDMFALEYEDWDSEYGESGDAVNPEENEDAMRIKTFGELQEETSNLLKVIRGSDGEVSEADRRQARETLHELRGVDLFSQVESVSGASRIESMMQELTIMWNKEYEKGD